jgi:hypothetical protein
LVGSLFYHPPPFKPKSPIYLLDRVLLIWFSKVFLSRHFWTASYGLCLWHQPSLAFILYLKNKFHKS